MTLDPSQSFYLMLAVFVAGYILIAIEHLTKINKGTIALLMAVGCWTIHFITAGHTHEQNIVGFSEHLGNLSQIIFFILGALTLVETISAHKGFSIISDLIEVGSKRRFLWTVCILTFFLSAVLDNLTTTIVMVSLISKLLDKGEDRLIIGGAIVIAANAGGAWTPIGDVTTTMLWIGGQLSTTAIMKELFIPSVACLFGALGILSITLKGNFPQKKLSSKDKVKEPMANLIFFLGLASLVFVPIFKVLTGMPPFMGVLLGLGLVWLVTDYYHGDDEKRSHLKVPHIISKIDMSGVLFFLGILLAVDALEEGGILRALAVQLDQSFSSYNVIAILMGIFSAIIDNVPLVAGLMSMYDLSRFPQDHSFWQLVAYCAGTGGSLLIIGSAAGVVFMGMEKVSFYWYLKKITLAAFAGYVLGICFYLIAS